MELGFLIKHKGHRIKKATLKPNTVLKKGVNYVAVLEYISKRILAFSLRQNLKIILPASSPITSMGRHTVITEIINSTI